MRCSLLCGVLCGALALGCSSTPPPGWAGGGARLLLTHATWTTPDGVIEVGEDGKVVDDGTTLFVLDRVGRVYDDSHRPVAMLMADGLLAGNDDTNLGHVGVTNAAPPGSGTAWLSVLPDGNVLYFDPDGERSAGGKWTGCAGPQLRTCTLVSHLVTLRRVAVASQQSSMYVGLGVGIYR